MIEDSPLHNVVVIGPGRIGSSIAKFLAKSGDYRVTVVDKAEAALATFRDIAAVNTALVDIHDSDALHNLLIQQSAMISAFPWAPQLCNFHLAIRLLLQ